MKTPLSLILTLILCAISSLFLNVCSKDNQSYNNDCPKNEFKQGDIFKENTTNVCGVVDHIYDCTDKVAVIVYLKRNPKDKTLSKSFEKNYLVFLTSEIKKVERCD